MKTWSIIVRGGRPVSAALLGSAGEVLRRSEPVWTVTELGRLCGKSRRQLYRDIDSGMIRPLGKFLGEWLVDSSALAALRPPPGSVRPLLPEHDLRSIDPWKERELFLSRILRYGGRERLRWAFSFYGEAAIRDFVARRGAGSLDARSLTLWGLVLGVRPAPAAPAAPARRAGARWGGSS